MWRRRRCVLSDQEESRCSEIGRGGGREEEKGASKQMENKIFEYLCLEMKNGQVEKSLESV